MSIELEGQISIDLFSPQLSYCGLSIVFAVFEQKYMHTFGY